MNVTLRDEDALAVDLLLDSSAASRADGRVGPAVFVSPADGVSSERVQGAEKVLSLLRWLPSEEPAGDLMARTMRRVADGDPAANRLLVDPVIHTPHPHA